jgi:hypothetical protein
VHWFRSNLCGQRYSHDDAIKYLPLPPSSVEVKNAWSYTSTPLCAFVTWCSVKAQGQLYLYKIRTKTKHCSISYNNIYRTVTAVHTALQSRSCDVNNAIPWTLNFLCVSSFRFYSKLHTGCKERGPSEAEQRNTWGLFKGPLLNVTRQAIETTAWR